MHLKIPVISIKYAFYNLGIFSNQHLFILWGQKEKKFTFGNSMHNISSHSFYETIKEVYIEM